MPRARLGPNDLLRVLVPFTAAAPVTVTPSIDSDGSEPRSLCWSLHAGGGVPSLDHHRVMNHIPHSSLLPALCSRERPSKPPMIAANSHAMRPGPGRLNKSTTLLSSRKNTRWAVTESCRSAMSDGVKFRAWVKQKKSVFFTRRADRPGRRPAEWTGPFGGGFAPPEPPPPPPAHNM